MKRRSKGQALTEMVLLFPLFMFFMFGMVKIYSMLVLAQKIEIAAFYAGRRWQLESHRNAAFETGFDDGVLRKDIENQVRDMLGCNTPSIRNFLDLNCNPGGVAVDVQRTQVWNVVRLTVYTTPWKIPLMPFNFKPFTVTKYVPSRDRPIGYNLPGI